MSSCLDEFIFHASGKVAIPAIPAIPGPVSSHNSQNSHPSNSVQDESDVLLLEQKSSTKNDVAIQEIPKYPPDLDDTHEAIQEHLDERAAIQEYDVGVKWGRVENTIHGIPISELRELAGDDWAEIQNDQDTLESFAHAVATRRMRESGQRPAHYTQISICQHCGPVWLWEGAPEHVQGCPWCFNRVQGVPVPRPGKQTNVKE